MYAAALLLFVALGIISIKIQADIVFQVLRGPRDSDYKVLPLVSSPKAKLMYHIH